MWNKLKYLIFFILFLTWIGKLAIQAPVYSSKEEVNVELNSNSTESQDKNQDNNETDSDIFFQSNDFNYIFFSMTFYSYKYYSKYQTPFQALYIPPPELI